MKQLNFVLETHNTKHIWPANCSAEFGSDIYDTVIKLCEKYGVPDDFEVLNDSSPEMLAQEIFSFYDIGTINEEMEYDWLYAYFEEEEV